MNRRRTTVVDELISSNTRSNPTLSDLLNRETYSQSPPTNSNIIGIVGGNSSPLSGNSPSTNVGMEMYNDSLTPTNDYLGVNKFNNSTSVKQNNIIEDDTFIQVLKKTSQQNAIESVCRLLESASDLDKLPDLKQTTKRQLEKLETQMTTLSSTQIEEADQAIQLVTQVRDDYLKGRLDDGTPSSLFQNMRDLCVVNDQLIENYDVIGEVLITYRNVKKTIEKLSKLTVLQKQIKRIKRKLADTNDVHLLQAHEDICSLEEIKEDALKEVKAKAIRSDYYSIFEEYFQMIDDIRERFETVVWLRFTDIEYTCETEPECIVRIIRIIEKEEARDERKRIEYEEQLAEVQRNKRKQKNKRKNDKLITISSGKDQEEEDEENERISNVVLEPKIKRMKEECFKRMRQYVADKYREAVYEAQGVEDKIQGLNMLLGDKLNEGVTRHVIPCFPFFANAHEEELTKYIDGLVDSSNVEIYNSMTMGEKLKIIKWLSDEYPHLVDEAIEKPKSFEAQRSHLIGDYINSRSSFMVECTANIVAQDFKNFDEIPLNANARNYPTTPSVVEIFTFINNQLDELMDTEIEDIVPTATNSLMASLRYFIDCSYEKLERYINDIPLTILCALINNNTTAIDYIEVMEQRIEHFPIEQGFSSLNDYFKQNAFKMTDLLCDKVIFRDAERFMDELFTETWITLPAEKISKEEKTAYLKASPVYKMVIQIFEPYANDLEGDLLEMEFRDYLINRLADKFICGYLEKLLFAKKKIKFKDALLASNQMKEDIRLIRDFFCATVEIEHEGGIQDTVERMDSKVFKKKYYEPMKVVFTILKAVTADEVCKAVKDMLDKFNDVSYDTVLNLMNTREDFIKKDKQDLDLRIEAIYSEYEDSRDLTAKPTIFSKIDKTPVDKRKSTKKKKKDTKTSTFDLQELEEKSTNNKKDTNKTDGGEFGESLSAFLGEDDFNFDFDAEDDEEED
ncbi:hypothetical protein ABK040_001799 [Willaertia magna]